MSGAVSRSVPLVARGEGPSARPIWLLLSVLGLWACGSSGTPEASKPEVDALATAGAEQALSCAASEVANGNRTCTGSFAYSLECHELKASEACGESSEPRTCTSYKTCEHPDFGRTRRTYQKLFENRVNTYPGTCDGFAQQHLTNTFDINERAGITFTFTERREWRQVTYNGGTTYTNVEFLICDVTYQNYPAPNSGTGPQCGTDSFACLTACVNHQMCQHPDFGLKTTRYDSLNLTVYPEWDPNDTCQAHLENYLYGALTPIERAGTTYSMSEWVEYHPFGDIINHCDLYFEIPVYNWSTGAQCGTMIGPCTPTSVSHFYNTCRHPTHALVPEAECGAGFDGVTSASGSTSAAALQAQAEAQWAASQSAGAPVFDTPLACSVCQAPIVFTPQQVSRQIYTAAAMSKKNAKLDILAGAAYHLALDNPTMTSVDLTAALGAIASALNAYDVDPTKDGSGHRIHLMLRILSEASTQPAMTNNSASARALRAYTRDFLASMRQVKDRFRRLAVTEYQEDRYVDAEAYVAGAWGQLFDLAATSPALRLAVDDGSIGTALTVRTTDKAQVLLGKYPLQPLKQFLTPRLEEDGSLGVSSAEIKELVSLAGAKGVEVATAYANNIFTLNAAEQQYRDKLALKKTTPTATQTTTSEPSPEKDALVAAAATAESKDSELKESFKDAKEGVSGALGLAASLASVSNDPDFAKDIKTFSTAMEQTIDAVAKYSESSVKIAKKLAGILELGATGMEIVSAVVFTGQMVGAVMKILELFGPQKPTPEEKILEQVVQLKDLVGRMRTEMNVRFDRIDKKLNLIYSEMNRQFALVNWDLGTISQDVGELQSALYTVHTDINRMDRRIYQFLSTLERRDFRDLVATRLFWRERVLNGTVLPFSPEFVDAEGLFYAWGYIHAEDDLAAGPYTRAYGDDAVLTELNAFPLASNINYLSRYPSMKWPGTPALDDDRLVNPLDWSIAGEAYSQLLEEWPEYVPDISALSRTDLIEKGTKLQTALRAARSAGLFTKLGENYDTHWLALKNELLAAEELFEKDPHQGLSRIDMWGGPDQLPHEHVLQGQRELPRCDGQPEYQSGVNTLTYDMGQWPHDELRAFMVAHNLGLGTLDTCLEAYWTWDRYSYTELGTVWWFRLHAKVNVRYKGVTVYSHRYDPDIENSKFIRPNDPPFDPNVTYSPYWNVAYKWAQVKASPVVHLFPGEAGRTQVRADVTAALKGRQKTFYASVVTRLTQAGDPIAMAADRLSGARKLWESYVVLTLPLSLQGNEPFRELLYGAEAVLAGRDWEEDEDTHLNDVQDAYRFFSNAAEPPTHNILTDIDKANGDRKGRLKAAISSTLSRLESTGDHESDDWVNPTLLRLRLLGP